MPSHSEIHDWERIGRIIVQVKNCRQLFGDHTTDKILNDYLAIHLSEEDFQFWSFLQQVTSGNA